MENATRNDAGDLATEQCGLVEAACACVRVKGHAGAHVCSCAGSWTFNDKGAFVSVNFPQAAGTLGTPRRVEGGKKAAETRRRRKAAFIEDGTAHENGVRFGD